MLERGLGIDNINAGAIMGLSEKAKWIPKWKIEKFNSKGDLFETDEFEGNSLLIEGISEFMKVALGIVGSVAFSNANARIGVGNGTTAVASSQTSLQGGSKAFAIMDATYPQVSNNTMTFRSTFGAGTAAFRWEEFTIVNGADDTAKNLNRKVEFHGEKASADTWCITCSITIA